MKKSIYFLSLLFLFACGGQKQQSGNQITLLSDSAFSTTLDGKNITLYTLESGAGITMQVTNFGGPEGFDMKVWDVDSVSTSSIHLSYISPDGEEGFPGTVSVKMVYTLTQENEFKITYEATTGKSTHVNLSHHSFFNLKGAGNGTITDHLLTINASHITPVDSVLIPTGEIVSVEDTPFDFRQATLIGVRINEDNEQLKNGLGYDHNWVIDRKTANDVEFIASLYEPNSGRLMEVWSDQPGLQFYSGNFLDGAVTGKYGKAHNYREAVALETQKYPDTPNQPQFPSTRLNPKEVYRQTCIYKFSVKAQNLDSN